MDRVIVKSTIRHMLGQLVAGVDGTCRYIVNPETGVLHLDTGHGMHPDPGCRPEDAAELAQFPGYEVLESKKRRTPPPPPPTAGEGGDSEKSPDSGDADASPAASEESKETKPEPPTSKAEPKAAPKGKKGKGRK